MIPGDLVVKRLRQQLADGRRMGLVLAVVDGEALVLWSEERRAPVVLWHLMDALSRPPNTTVRPSVQP